MAKTNLGKVVGDSAFEDWLKKNPGKTWEDFMEEIKGKNAILQYGLSCFMRGNDALENNTEWIKLKDEEQYLDINEYPHLEGILEKRNIMYNFDFKNITENKNDVFSITPLSSGGIITNQELLYKLFKGTLNEGETISITNDDNFNELNQLGFELSGPLFEEIKNLNKTYRIYFYASSILYSGTNLRFKPESFFGCNKIIDDWVSGQSYEQISKFRISSTSGLQNGIFDISKYDTNNINYIKNITFGNGSKIIFEIQKYVYVVPSKFNSNIEEIMYIGNKIKINEQTIYSYSKNKTLCGETPLYLAVENKLPYYVEGITMSEPIENRIGYMNKYDVKTDTWELVKTHEKQDGYYYLENGDLKYIPKPNNYSIWSFKTNIWIEDITLKEKAKKKLLNKYIELEIKKDKMIDLEIDTTTIVEEIEKIKKDLEEING